MRFLELFLRCRGNLRDVERTLGLSYPTVRARLDALLASLGYTAAASPDTADQRMVIHAVLERAVAVKGNDIPRELAGGKL